MQGLWQDVRAGWRSLRGTPGFTFVAIAMLAIGIAGTAIMFTVTDTALLQPLPYRDASRVVVLWELDRLRDTAREGFSWPDYLDLAARQKVFSQLAAYQTSQQTLTQQGSEPERVTVAAVAHQYFAVFGRSPEMGRGVSPTDDRPGGARIAILSAGLWQQRYGASPGTIGRSITLDGQDYTVAGIFSTPFRAPTAETDVWIPLQIDPASAPRGRHGINAVGLLRPEVSVERAQSDVAAIARQLETEYANDNLGRGIGLDSLQNESTRRVRLALLVLMAAIAVVLLITCANIASMLLSRAVTRVREVAIRSALGASRWRIVRQFAVEGVLLSLTAGVFGLLLASNGLGALLAVAPVDLPRVEDMAIDRRAVVFVLALTLFTGLLFGLVPAIQTLRENLQTWLKENVRGASAGRATHRLRRLLVVAEIAMSATLLIGAALLIKSFWSLQAVDPGFKTAQVLKLELQLPASRYPQPFNKFPNWPEVQAFHTQLLDRVRQLPGVRSAALAYSHPLDSGFTSRYEIAGRPPVPEGEQDEIRIRTASPGYFATVGIPLMRGRLTDDRDRADQPRVTLINEAAARRLFAGEDPIGQSIAFFNGPYRIVGIVGNERFMGLDRETPPAVYPPLAQVPFTSLSLLVRGEGDPASLAPALRREVGAIDPNLAVYDVATLGQVLETTIAQPQFNSLLVGAFAAVAWLLAILGVHGVLSYAVAQRSREIGVRLALGAQPRDVLRLVLGEGMLTAAAGLAIGLVAALLLSRVMLSLLYAVDPRDVTVFAGVALSLLGSALVASWLPARRAMRVDPAVALKRE